MLWLDSTIDQAGSGISGHDVNDMLPQQVKTIKLPRGPCVQVAQSDYFQIVALF